MENNVFQFTTNMNCGACLSRIKPALDTAEGIVNWAVDTDNPAKILTVTSNGITPEEVTKIIAEKGFKVEAI